MQVHATPEPHDGPAAAATPAVTAIDAKDAPRRLHVWVVGNPVSGGNRGALVLTELETRFRSEFGSAAVHATCSSSFLRDVPPDVVTPAPPRHTSSGGSCLQHTLHPATTATPAPLRGAASSSSASSALDAKWTAAAGVSTSCVPATAEPEVRTVVIRTDQGGHSKAVSHALCQRILRSRLEEEEENRRRASAVHVQQPQPQQQDSTASTRTMSHANAGVPPAAAHHVVLVVGGDGTLSEVVNGLCEGTLAAFATLSSRTDTHLANDAVASLNALASHARVEREAAVLSHLLPAVLYVPGGTGSDFAKLGLCCSSAEDALRVVRDGLPRQLFASTVNTARENGFCRRAATEMESGGGVCNRTQDAVTVPPLAGASARPGPMSVTACAVDVGRIEFLRTGHRHFFINECSTGMSCDVIQRGERFKQSKWIAPLGGLLLFAASALVSLFLMTPKPLYICKLPPRTRRTAPSPHSACTAGKHVDGVSHHNASDSAEGGATDTSEDAVPRLVHPRAIPTRTATRGSTEATSSRAEPLTARAPFAPLDEQLRRLRAELRWSEENHHNSSSSSGSGSSPASISTSIIDHEAANHCAACAYAVHAATPMPPPHAKTVRCTLQTPSDQLLKLLDLTDAELLARQRAQQQQRHEHHRIDGAPESTSTTASSLDDVEHSNATAAVWARAERHAAPIQAPHPHVRHSGTVLQDVDGDGKRDDSDDDLAALTWVEMPSSMVAFANGRWYGGGMLVAPHASPTDGLLSCTNWVATIAPFISGVVSLYTGRHVHWRTTTAFDGERFLITDVPPTTPRATRAGPADGTDEEASEGHMLFMEADGEVLEAAPAIVELAGKLTFLVPSTAVPSFGTPAPGTARERVAGIGGVRDAAPAHALARTPTLPLQPANQQLRRLRDGLGVLWRRSVARVQRCCFVPGIRRRYAASAIGAARGDEEV